ncbi:Tetratricopeptide repeat protein 34 [Merluccius polli]|uniref:Tetratricopeptide repeat protein 34 n=1 Tax=Merluccius polli TaxID=89951 RepID=A0AA47MP16_MERPO|nr:Tetratricopeptide repeat protein 34 [Merluccius polli]
MTSPAPPSGAAAAAAAAAAALCRDADRLLGSGDPAGAAHRYTAAFKTHAAATVAHMRALEKPGLAAVVSTLEDWLDRVDPVPTPDGTGTGSGSRAGQGLAAVFLSTLSPNNLSATVFKMESLLRSGGGGGCGGCEEIFARCTALLAGGRSPRPEGGARAALALALTRALASLLRADPRDGRWLRLYLRAYEENPAEAVALVRSRQAQHLPKIAKAFAAGGEEEEEEEPDAAALSEFLQFLLAVSPGDREVLEAQASHLFFTGLYAQSEEVYSVLLDGVLPGSKVDGADPGERKEPAATAETRARLLTGRAAARFSAGGRAAEACGDLGAAFELHAAAARRRFRTLFAGDRGTGAAAASARRHLRLRADRALAAYRERVLLRADLRSDEGVELLDPAVAHLRTLCRLEPDGGCRELRVRLAECLLLRGERREALWPPPPRPPGAAHHSYQNTVRVLRGYARVLSDDQRGAMEDFQAVIEHSAPHPCSCVRALCGRGLLRAAAGRRYLAALDYVTASRLQPQEAGLAVRCLVPWNRRGLLLTVLLEQGRVMLEGRETGPRGGDRTRGGDRSRGGESSTPGGVHCLAVLLAELQPGADGPQILAADALYQLGRVEEAHRLLLALGAAGQRASVLARLALLQLHRGFLYDAHQLLKKLIQCGDTSCLRPLLALAHPKDKMLLQEHCHLASKRILVATAAPPTAAPPTAAATPPTPAAAAPPNSIITAAVAKDEGVLREAVAYLSIAIMASGGGAADSLLERARCYAALGQRKTAIYDFSAILKEQPGHVHALCGRGFTYLTLNQQKECTEDILAALQLSVDGVTKDLLSLKDKARKLVCDWLEQYCRSDQLERLVAEAAPCEEDRLREAFLISGALLRVDSRNPRWHLLYVDTLLAKGEAKAAGAHLSQVFGQEPREAVAQARLGVVEAWHQDYRGAAHRLSRLAEKDPAGLDFLLSMVPLGRGKRLTQAAAQEASSLSSDGDWTRTLPLLSVAVRASSGAGRTWYLRQRAACLARLGLHERAVADLDAVIRSHDGGGGGGSGAPEEEEGDEEARGARAEDLCGRGRSLLLSSREGPALDDFSRALALHRGRAVRCAEAGVGRRPLAERFLQGALRRYGEQRLGEAWKLAETGLVLDEDNADLRRLRARVKREVAGPCNVN